MEVLGLGSDYGVRGSAGQVGGADPPPLPPAESQCPILPIFHPLPLRMHPCVSPSALHPTERLAREFSVWWCHWAMEGVQVTSQGPLTQPPHSHIETYALYCFPITSLNHPGQVQPFLGALQNKKSKLHKNGFRMTDATLIQLKQVE